MVVEGDHKKNGEISVYNIYSESMTPRNNDRDLLKNKIKTPMFKQRVRIPENALSNNTAT